MLCLGGKPTGSGQKRAMRIVIVGAGVAGLSIGWRLRQAGAAVTVFERGQPARAATWAAAGMIAVAGEMNAAPTAESEFAHRSSLLWPGFATEVEAASGLKVGYVRCGALMVAPVAVAGEAAGVEKLTALEARAKEPMLTGDFANALWAPGEAQVDSRALGLALAEAFISSGGDLAPNEPVSRFDVQNGRAVAVVTPVRRLEADAFILAAGAWSSGIDGLPAEAVPPIRPVKGEMIALSPPSGAAIPRHIVWGNGVYLVPRAGRVLVGATSVEAGFDADVTDAATNWLRSSAISVMPALTTWNIAERWAGLRPASPDGLPLLGHTVVQGLYAATGQFRNGILFAPAIAENLSRLVLEHAAQIPAFDPRRFHKRHAAEARTS